MKLRIVFFILSILLVLAIGVLDYASGYELGLSAVYLVPIYLAVFNVGRYAGLTIAIMAAFLWSIGDLLAGKPISHILVPVWNTSVRGILFCVFAFFLIEFKKLLQRERSLARVDFKTGIANSQAFYELANVEISRSRRNKYSLALAYIDCDSFKHINDTVGHKGGDQLLRDIAAIIKRNIRDTDICARLGGDEFVILFSAATMEIAKKIMQRINEHLAVMPAPIGQVITFSSGVVVFEHPSRQIDEMIHMADTLMYRAKKEGRNRVLYEVCPENASEAL